MEGMGRRADNEKCALSEAVDRGQWLCLWKRGGHMEILAMTGGRCFCQIGLVGGQGGMLTYVVVFLPPM